MSDYSELKRLVAQGSLPPVVTTLIAENERLNAESKQLILLECYGGTAQAAINLLAERDQLKAENAGLKTGYEAYERVNVELRGEIEALRKGLEGRVLVPVEPSPGLLMSMAIRNDHALGCPGYYDQKILGRGFHDVGHARMVECALTEMRKLHEEVVGAGFYSPEKEAGYVAMSKEALL